MFKAVVQIVVMSIFAVLAGCDGYARTLYLKETRNVDVPWHVGRTIIEISGNQDVIKIVEKIAVNLGLQPDKRRENAWVDNSEYWMFSMSVRRVNKDLWAIELTDWPSNQRSKLSSKAEEMIRSKIEILPNKAAHWDASPRLRRARVARGFNRYVFNN